MDLAGLTNKRDPMGAIPSTPSVIWIAVSTMLLIGCSRAATPKLVIDSLEKNAGSVWKGQPAQFDFLVKNAGDEPLEIDVKPGCGCTVAKFDKTIEAGAEGHILATLTTDHVEGGRVTKFLTVHSNDPETKEKGTQLRITVTVKPYVEVSPSYTPYIQIYRGEGRTLTYNLFSNDETPLEVKSVKSSLSFLSTKLIPPEEDSNSKAIYKLVVTLPPDAPAGLVNGYIQVQTTHPKAPVLNISLLGIIKQEITATPSPVNFPVLKAGEEKTIPVVITKRKGEFHILKAVSDSEHVTVEVETNGEVETKDVGKTYRLQFKYDGKAPAGDLRGKVIVSTDDKEQPEILISYFVRVP